MRAQTFPSRFTLGLPKQKKLKDPVLEYLDAKGFKLVENNEKGILKHKYQSIPDIDVALIRAEDALTFMKKKAIDLAIIGKDILSEKTGGDNPAFEKPITALDLGVAKCSFDLAVPNQEIQKFKNVSALNGLTIATSYPNILSDWLKSNNVKPAEILVLAGGVEASVGMGIADVVADLVATGDTLRRHELTSKFKIASTSAVAVYYPPTPQESQKSIKCPNLVVMLRDEFLRELTKTRTAEPVASYSLKELEYEAA